MEGCIQKMKDGDFSPLNKLYSSCFDRFVCRACRIYKCKRAEAKDAYQEAIIATFEDVRSGTISCFTHGIKAYVNRLATNTLIDIIDHNEVHSKFCERHRSGSEPIINNDAEAEIESEHFNSLLQRSLNRLKPKDREIFELFYFKHFDYQAIASAMNYSNVDSVRIKIDKIMGKLAKLMRDSGGL
jgi:RNA polymerase sigma factor (sigma-70 family)